MHIIFEEHQYQASDVNDALKDISTLQDVDKKISVSYVGYFYNVHLQDCVFILPKVLLTDMDVDGKSIEVLANVESSAGEGDKRYITPEDIITPEGQEKHLPEKYRDFIYKFAVWVYRSLSVYRSLNPKSKVIYYRPLPQEGRGRRHKANTYLDIILSLVRFNRENQNYFLFTIKNLHRGNNKINWTKTISKTQGVMQGNDVLYFNPVNKKRVINFEEELFIIFFSILNYINEHYGFRCPIKWQYDLITGQQFKAYINGRGKARLRQIKYKYFSDKALLLWDLCYAFFDSAHKININTSQKEYLLAKNFYIVFEAMIDELIGNPIVPKGLKEQRDGKRVDHMFTYRALTASDEQKDEIYYIGDSKYYKVGHPLGTESIYKQYTYARNVIQWNIDLFMTGKDADLIGDEKDDYIYDTKEYQGISLRKDEALTEGYNVIPNFFLSAFINENRQYDAGDDNIKPHETKPSHFSVQFRNRLFDRDTLILSHYDVNFLYVLFLYARNKRNEKAQWKEEVRKRFRREIQTMLNKYFQFHVMTPREHVNGQEVLKQNFKDVMGKIFQPYPDEENGQKYYSLALEKPEEIKDEQLRDDVKKENKHIKDLLEPYFEIIECSIGEDKRKDLKTPPPDGIIYAQEQDLALLITKEGPHFDIATKKLQETGKVGIALKMDGAVLQLVEGFTKAKYLIIHNKSDRYKVFGFDGKGPKLIPGDQVGDIVKTKQGESLYLVYQVDMRLTFYLGEINLSVATKGNERERYSPQLWPVSKLVRKQEADNSNESVV